MTDADLAEIPTFAVLYHGSNRPAFRAYVYDVAAGRKSDLHRLHTLAGEPAGKSPMAFLQEFRERYGRRAAVRTDGRLLADRNLGLAYLVWADEGFEEVVIAMRTRASRMSPAALLLLSPDSVTAALAIDATMKRDGCSRAEAVESIQRGVGEATAELEEWDRRVTTTVMRGC